MIELLKPFSVWPAGCLFRNYLGIWKESYGNICGIGGSLMSSLLKSKHAVIITPEQTNSK